MEKQDAFTQALLRAMDAAEQEVGVRCFEAAPGREQAGGISRRAGACRRGRSRTASTGWPGWGSSRCPPRRWPFRQNSTPALRMTRSITALRSLAPLFTLESPLLTTDQKNRWIAENTRHPPQGALRVSKTGKFGGLSRADGERFFVESRFGSADVLQYLLLSRPMDRRKIPGIRRELPRFPKTGSSMDYQERMARDFSSSRGLKAQRCTFVYLAFQADGSAENKPGIRRKELLRVSQKQGSFWAGLSRADGERFFVESRFGKRRCTLCTSSFPDRWIGG